MAGIVIERTEGMGRAAAAWVAGADRGQVALASPDHDPHEPSEQACRHDVRPGSTGWAQSNGRIDRSWPDKLAQVKWRFDHRSFGLYVRILLRTLWAMVRREGVSLDGHATTGRFDEAGARADDPDQADC